MTVTIEIRDTAKGPELSIVGDSWLRSGRDIRAGGQLGEHLLDELAHPAPPATRAAVERLVELWDRWHLNGMQAGCEHQRAENWRACPGHYHAKGPWLGSKPAPTQAAMPQGWRLEVVDDGIMITRHLYVTITNCAGAVEEHAAESWQSSTRCSLDMLSKPRPTCGYKYGTAWLYEALPADVVAELAAWPEPVSA